LSLKLRKQHKIDKTNKTKYKQKQSHKLVLQLHKINTLKE